MSVSDRKSLELTRPCPITKVQFSKNYDPGAIQGYISLSSLHLKDYKVIIYSEYQILSLAHVSTFDMNYPPLGAHASASYLVLIRRLDPRVRI